MTAERIYAVLLRFYPPAFRNEYGREMTQLFRDLYVGRGPVTLTFWMTMVLDVARSAPALRVEAWGARRRENTRTLGGS
ncbi:MAG: hypothetical protein M3Z10_00935 [Gemmatimonadota bacterium]|nr:hypothetical protein [Gemmatimonadota bacterium]